MAAKVGNVRYPFYSWKTPFGNLTFEKNGVSHRERRGVPWAKNQVKYFIL